MNTKEMIPDLEIVEGIKNCRKKSYNDLFIKYYKLIKYLCLMKCHDEDLAEDYAIVIFEKIIDKIDNFNPEKGSLKTWITTITNNFLIDKYRGSKKVIDDLSLDEYPILGEIASSRIQSEADDIFDIKEDVDVQILQKSLNSISERDRVICLFRAEGRPYKEIAEFLNISETVAKTAYSRSVKKIKELFAIEKLKN